MLLRIESPALALQPHLCCGATCPSLHRSWPACARTKCGLVDNNPQHLTPYSLQPQPPSPRQTQPPNPTGWQHRAARLPPMHPAPALGRVGSDQGGAGLGDRSIHAMAGTAPKASTCYTGFRCVRQRHAQVCPHCLPCTARTRPRCAPRRPWPAQSCRGGPTLGACGSSPWGTQT